jgi:CMP-N-acetylneuraminic acid synthetase
MILIIPLRSGSKRLKDKNIQKIRKEGGTIILDNENLTAHFEENTDYMFELVYKTAVNSRLFDKIIFAVDKKYEKIVKDTLPLAEIYVRNKKNSRDESPLIDLVRELKLAYNLTDKYCCILYSTSILTTEKHLIDAYKECSENDYDCVFPVIKQNVELVNVGDGTISSSSDWYNDIITFKHADAFFIFNLQESLDNNTIISNNNDGFIVIGELEYQEVHTEKDIEILKKKYQLRLNFE